MNERDRMAGNPIHGVVPVAGELLVFLVDSDESGKPPWRVDLQPFDGVGRCNCWAFLDRRKGPSQLDRLNAGERNRGCLCKHLVAAHLFNSIVFTKMVVASADRHRTGPGSDAESNE